MIKEMINELNKAMYDGKITFDVVESLCNQLSKLTGKDYRIINKRFCYKEYDKFHYAYTNA